MKPINYKMVDKPPETSFLIRYAEVNHTFDKFHFHNEYEILYNIENWGTRFVGDSIKRFRAGDLVLVGSNVPHYWKSSETFYNDLNIRAKVIVIQFLENFLGEYFFNAPEINSITNLLTRAQFGIHFKGRDAIKIGGKIVDTYEQKGWRRLLNMLEVLCLMSESQDYELLASPGFVESSKYDNQEKISEIFNFLIINYSKDLKLEDIAKNFCMHPSAFCKYIKKYTSKTFSQILNEVRIGFSCKKMIYTDNSISEIAYECGFINVPYFNRVFKLIKGNTPQQYRRLHRWELINKSLDSVNKVR